MEDIRSHLLALQDELQRRLGKTQSDERHETADGEDSNAQLWEASEIRDGLDDEAVGELRQVNRALERLNAGTYGICISCERPIDARRLEAVPYAEFCIACADQCAWRSPRREGSSSHSSHSRSIRSHAKNCALALLESAFAQQQEYFHVY